MRQQHPGPLSHSLQNRLILHQPLENPSNHADLLRASIGGGFGQELDLRIKTQTIVFEQQLQARALPELS